MKIRKASPKDFNTIATFIKLIADYEKLLDQIKWTDESLYHQLFVENNAEVILGEKDGKVIGFALYFYNFSTFEGKKGLYLEDLYILEAYRKFGYGKQFFKALLKIAKENNCGRMEWVCLNWNEPSIGFYKKLNAKPMQEWTTWRLESHQFDSCLD